MSTALLARWSPKRLVLLTQELRCAEVVQGADIADTVDTGYAADAADSATSCPWPQDAR